MLYLLDRSPDASKRVKHRIQEAVRFLGENPGAGHERSDLTMRPVRFWAVHSYLIVYRSDVNPIHILRVLHGAQDLPALLRPGDAQP